MITSLREGGKKRGKERGGKGIQGVKSFTPFVDLIVKNLMRMLYSFHDHFYGQLGAMGGI